MSTIYSLALELVRSLKVVLDEVHAKDADLGRQARRAATSVVLNIAEASGSSGGVARQRFASACGSVKELRAGIEVAEALGYVAALDAETKDTIDRVAATTFKLSRR